MENKIKHVSMYEITKMAHEGKDDFEKKMDYEKWLEIENDYQANKRIDKEKISEMMQELDNQVAEQIKEKYKNESQDKETYLDLPLNVYLSWDKIWLCSMDEETEIIYTLHLATDVNTGKLSIQYKGEDGTFLSHKKVIKAIKKENNL